MVEEPRRPIGERRRGVRQTPNLDHVFGSLDAAGKVVVSGTEVGKPMMVEIWIEARSPINKGEWHGGEQWKYYQLQP